MAHILQTLTDLDERATIVSVDGIGAYDLNSRNSMLQGFLMMENGDRVLPFVRCFFGSPSTNLWEDEMGVSQDISQGEGGEQGDPLMLMLFALGQHRVLVAIQERLWDGERVFAFLDDIYVVCSLDRVVDVNAIIQQELLLAHARISVHHGKTQVWNRGGVEPQDIDILTAEARARVPGAVVWRGAQELPATKQGLNVLGAPIGHPQYVQEFLRRKTEEQQVLLQRIPLVNDPQASWLLLWMCASTRVNLWLGMVLPELTLPFAESHDRNVWQCLQTILDVRGAPAEAQTTAFFVATDIGGPGPCQCRKNPSCCALGQLGRLSGHGQTEAPDCGRGDGCRT